MNIVNVGYDSTNYYVLADANPKVLIDVGWPGTLPKLQHQCRRTSLQLSDIKFLLITHYHPDHGGLAQELINAGAKLILLENQVPAVPVLRTYMKPQNHYVEIDLSGAAAVTITDSRAFLARLGIHGEIIATPGHSDDSITLVLDEGAAFVGDLTHPLAVAGDATLLRSWEKVRSLGVKTIYPGHGPVWHLD